jgi:hypothetical protein
LFQKCFDIQLKQKKGEIQFHSSKADRTNREKFAKRKQIVFAALRVAFSEYNIFVSMRSKKLHFFKSF